MTSTRTPRQKAMLRRRAGQSAPALRRRRRFGASQVALGAFAGTAGLVALVVLTVMARLAVGPVNIEGLSERVTQALSERLGTEWNVKVAGAAIAHSGWRPSLRVSGIEIRSPEGMRVLGAPRADVVASPWALFAGQFTATAVSFSGLDLKVAIAKDGSLALTAGDAAQPTKESSGRVELRDMARSNGRGAEARPPPLAVAATSLLELLTATDGLLGTLDEAAIENARLALVDDQGTERFKFTEVALSFARPRDNLRRFSFSLKGATQRWMLEGTVAGRGTGARVAAFSFSNVPVSDLLALTGKSNDFVASDMPLSGTVRIASAADGALSGLDAEINGGSSVVHVRDPDMDPIEVGAVRLVTSWDPALGAVVIREASFKAGETRISLTGRLDSNGPGGVWRLALNGRDGALSPLSPSEKPVAIETIAFEAGGTEAGGAILDRLEVSGATFGLRLKASVGTDADDGGVRLAVSGARSDARVVLRFWPGFAGRKVRDYLVDRVSGGIVEHLAVVSHITPADIARSQAREPLRDEVGRTEFTFSNVDITVAAGLPPITNATVTGVTSGRTAKIAVADAAVSLPAGRSLALSGGTFEVADTGQRRAPGVATFRMKGGADSFAALLRSDAIRALMPMDLEPASIKGNADLRVSVTVPLSGDVSAEEVQIGAKGALTGLSLDGLVGKDRLENANLNLSLDGVLLQLKGDGSVGGLPTAIEVRQPLPAGQGEAIATAVLDEAARASRGLSFGKQVSGPVTIKVIAPLARVENRGPRVEIDLAKAKVEDLLPGWTKPQGRPGRVAFVMNSRAGGGSVLDEFTLDSPGAVARGSVDLSAAGELEAARLSTMKLSPGDDMRVDVERLGNVYRVTVKGQVVDARPFLRAFSTGSDVRPKEDAKDFDLDLTASILAGYNDEAMTNATLKLARRGPDLRQAQLAGRFGRAPVSAHLIHPGDQPSQIIVQTDDGGALLRFADVYRRMSGGRLGLSLTANEPVQTGALKVENFSLRNEPALKRMVAQRPSQNAGPDDRSSRAPRIDGDNVAFTRLQAGFNRTAGRFELKDGIIWGNQVGIKLEGYVDFARDRADLAGTFVPAYALNNALGQLPLLGIFLTGQRDEGIFAVSFRISGLASAPTLTINPISAIAPGVVRKIFDALTPNVAQDWPDPPAQQPQQRKGGNGSSRSAP